MSLSTELIENLTAQVLELEALQAVYPKELVIADYGVLADINNYIAGSNVEIPQKLEYCIEISISKGAFELQVTLPAHYPNIYPEVYVRSSLLDRTQQMNLNKSLSLFMNSQEKGEPCIYALISWLQDDIDKYLEQSELNKKSKGKLKETEELDKHVFGRYWVYSHHIYSKFKRRDIADLAKENSLSGFTLAGKPGIICVEGALDDCEYWWQKVKTMNWHKILIKLVEEENLDNRNLDSLRKFSGFQEISFATSEKHNDMGQLLKYLTEHDSHHAFKEFFGVEGKSAQL
ncbi:RWD domain-containing protein 2A [Cephus cinctus]|uniref:RWD domain-containing protein 2A n=1 Tax=Cephus cinctus TaxID=211228 RepID=A0AAJ7BWA2_CEPCN|nr:RWD domain-containing protein 2A [Cephus cinctus]